MRVAGSTGVPLDERSRTYVVKVWEERRDVLGAEPIWRGSVADVSTGARTYFADVGELLKFLQLGLRVLLPPSLRS